MGEIHGLRLAKGVEIMEAGREKHALLRSIIVFFLQYLSSEQSSGDTDTTCLCLACDNVG